MRTAAAPVTHLKVATLLADLLEALLHTLEAGRGCGRVDEHEGVGRCDGQAPHGRELHVTRRVQDVHLKGMRAEKLRII